MRTRRTTGLALGLGLALTLAACGQNAAAPEAAGGAEVAEGAPTVGVILPETESSARWEGFDRPLLEAAMAEAGLDADIQNALGDEQAFATIADGFIAQGVDVLVIGPSRASPAPRWRPRPRPRASRPSTTTA